MKSFFKNSATLILFLLICGVYGCGHGSKSGPAANDIIRYRDTTQTVAEVKPPLAVKRRHTNKKSHKAKPDTLTVVVDTAKPVVAMAADTTKKTTDKSFPGEINEIGTGVYLTKIHHFTMRRMPGSPVSGKTKQAFILMKEDTAKTVAAVHPLPAPTGPQPLPTPPPLAPTPIVTKPKNLKFGILGYSYPPNIVVGESKDIHAFISIVYPASKVKDTLLKISVADDSSNSNDSINIFEPIRLYKYVTLTLIPTDSSIKVANYPQVSPRQEIDTLGGNKWSWGVLAKSADQPISKLKLIISTEDPQNYEEKIIPVYIKVNPHFFRKVYNFLMGNPNVLVVSILIPLATFIGGLLFAKWKKKNT
jgi:hypothetical protein